MKICYLVIAIWLIVPLNGCSQEQPQPQAITPVPTQISDYARSYPADDIQASGQVVPIKYTEMGFIKSAPVKEVLVKVDDHVTSGQSLVIQHLPALEYAIVSAEAAVESAESFARLQRFRRTILNQRGKTLYLTGPHEVLEVADSKVIQAQAALAKAEAELAFTRLIAPYAGTVVEVNATEGEFLPSGVPAVILADLSQFQIVTTDLNERDVSDLHMGQRAEIQIPALNQVLSGSISQVSPKAEVIDGDVIYKIVLDFDIQPDGLMWGMSADVFFNDE